MEPGRIQRHERRYLAQLLGVTLRTVELWADARRALAAAPVGRPPRSRHVRRRALRRVHRELLRQGKSAGWRPVEEALQGELPTRLVQECVGRCKRIWSWQGRRGRARRRVRTQVLARDVLWAEDAMQVGRVDKAAQWAEVVRDAASTRTAAPKVGAPANADDVVALLEQMAAARGGLPLALSLDNGGPYRSERLHGYLEQQQVVVLHSLPHVPQHNPVAERANGELRQESGLASDTVLQDAAEACERLEAARNRLNGARVRTSRGGYTAQQLDAMLPRGDDLVSREEFWNAVQANVVHAVQNAATPRARRLAEREAKLVTMENFGLIQRIRGDAPLRPIKSESVL